MASDVARAARNQDSHFLCPKKKRTHFQRPVGPEKRFLNTPLKLAYNLVNLRTVHDHVNQGYPVAPRVSTAVVLESET